MNPSPPSSSRREELVAVISVLVLLIGTATGNADVMLAMAMVALLVITLAARYFR